jgi:hypothetical protein
MTIRWFKTSKEDLYRKRLRKKPVKPKSPKPKKVLIPSKPRMPGVEPPIITMPFISKGSDVYAGWKDISHKDESYAALIQLRDKIASAGDAVEDHGVSWVQVREPYSCPGNHTTGKSCAELSDSGRWFSVAYFLSSMPETTAGSVPEWNKTDSSDGRMLGIMGHSHPGCECHVIVSIYWTPIIDTNPTVYAVSSRSAKPDHVSGISIEEAMQIYNGEPPTSIVSDPNPLPPGVEAPSEALPGPIPGQGAPESGGPQEI